MIQTSVHETTENTQLPKVKKTHHNLKNVQTNAKSLEARNCKALPTLLIEEQGMNQVY